MMEFKGIFEQKLDIRRHVKALDCPIPIHV